MNPSDTPTLRGPPVGCGPSRLHCVVCGLVLACVAACHYETLTLLDLALRCVYAIVIPIVLVACTDTPTLPLHVPADKVAVLADNLKRFYTQQAAKTNAELKRAAADVELQRAARDPAHFRKMSLVACKDTTGLQLPQQLRAKFNVDINAQPYGFGCVGVGTTSERPTLPTRLSRPPPPPPHPPPPL